MASSSKTERYANLDGTTPDKGFADLVRWLASRKQDPEPSFAPPVRENDGRALGESRAHLTWIGHATFAMKLGNKTIVTDPVWSERVGTQRRRARPGVALERMPPIDLVTVSHSHRDHMDTATLQRIGPAPIYVVPRDNADVLRGVGLPNVVELGWWESFVHGGVRVTLVPAQHWSMRTPFDRNRRLWGGFVYEAEEGAAYHAGDTAMSAPMFEEIARRFPSIDWAMLPIGAYEPSWFMQPQHMGPEEAARAFEILGAKTLCAMHWGTFRLTDEPMSEPPARLRRAIDPRRAWIFDIGETRSL